MDQTGLQVEILPKKFIVNKGSKNVFLKTKGETKEKVTVFLLAKADGHHCTL